MASYHDFNVPDSRYSSVNMLVFPNIRKKYEKIRLFCKRVQLVFTSLPKNGPREHYMRAVLLPNGYLEPVENQDSARLALLCDSDALLIRAAHAEAIPAKTQCEYIKI